MTMIDTAMGALRATAAKALGLNGKLTETCSREDSLLTNPPDAVVTMTPDAGRRTPDAGRYLCVRMAQLPKLNILPA